MLQFVIVYINVVQRILIDRLALAGNNEMRHHEFYKSQLDPPKVDREMLWIDFLC
jgi:hypothetical protein